MSLEPGHYALLLYQGEQRFHARLLLHRLRGSEWIIVTPDYDVYVEDISAGNPDLDAVRVANVDGSAPIGLRDRDIYHFNPMPDAARVRRLIDEGNRMAIIERARLTLCVEISERPHVGRQCPGGRSNG